MLEKFKQWAKGYPLMLLDDTYTNSYLEELDNPRELIYPHLGLEYEPYVFDKIMIQF